jgi:hypothetical protein
MWGGPKTPAFFKILQICVGLAKEWHIRDNIKFVRKKTQKFRLAHMIAAFNI